MDFFARQDASRRTTRYLVLLFGLAFLAVAVATAIVGMLVWGTAVDERVLLSTGEGFGGAADRGLEVFALIVLVTMGLMVLASLYRSATLSRGGSQVARMLGGTRIQGDDPDPLHRRLMHVVEEMAIASGLPVPEVYVLDHESGINAFAAGLTHADAAIAVTRGALERLTRAELQGVIAHEFSHILNGDMRLNLRLMGFGFGILVLSLIGRWLLRGSRFGYRTRNRGASAAILIGLGLTIIGGIGVFLSRLIKAGVSRSREALADASAVQFTREPLALAGALKKIGGYTAHLSSVEAEEVSHMLFGSAGRGFRGWFATHPPLVERIRALDPSFEAGDFPSAEPLPQLEPHDDIGASAMAGGPAAVPAGLDAAGTIESPELGAGLRSAIPAELYEAAHSRDASYLLVLALAIAADPATAESQIGLLEAQIGERRAAICHRLRGALAALDRRLWLPLLELTVPALKQRPAQQIEFLLELVDRIAAADNEQSLFEFTLQRLLKAYFVELGAAPGGRPKPSVEQCVHTLLATVATHGHEMPSETRAALAAGLATLDAGLTPAAEAALDRSRAASTFEDLDAALESLARLSTRARRQALAAAEATIRHDRSVSIAEAELFRAIAATLGCPIPPARSIG